ncbi:abnormal spindle-like microcephaly-associated protein homolog [Glossina fuscipes]|uniref:Abnormal spindle-like microcephaly-associated protein homolog n=1 Tax=Glossina fuscipes TaxID=7396 RepID=A0A9C6DZP3_9MUSC|nr:abnormal spindle-like microcephaly-associated protein homolog [Glossina fuscipes]
MHIHPSSPNSDLLLQSEESAAIKIQAGFRGYRVRKQLNHRAPHRSSARNGYHGSNSILRRQQRHQLAMSSQLQQDNTNSANSGRNQRDTNSSESDSNTVEDQCAIKIQAGVRGFLVRKKQKMAADAATKIQASFRGFKARKEVQKLRQM